MIYEAQGHVIEAHGTRTVYMRLGPEGRSVGAGFRVTNVKSPILSMESWSKKAKSSRPTVCKMSRGNRSVALEIVKILSGWTQKLIRRLKELLTPMQDLLRLWWTGYSKKHRRVQARSHEAFQTARAPCESSDEYLDSSSPVEDMRKRLRELRAPVWGNVASSAGERSD